jgi:hypothetical protein
MTNETNAPNIRDYFAGQALQGFLSRDLREVLTHCEASSYGTLPVADAIAALCGTFADAMLKERTHMKNDEIEAVARAICKADMVMPDELSMASGKPRWTQYTRQAKAALSAMRPVNQEMLEALKFYANPENYNEDYEVNFPFRDTKINFDRGAKAKQAIASAESGRGE